MVTVVNYHFKMSKTWDGGYNELFSLADTICSVQDNDELHPAPVPGSTAVWKGKGPNIHPMGIYKK